MAPTIQQVMEGIETRLATISGLRVSDILPDEISPPAAIIGVPDIGAYHATMQRGRMIIEPTVTVLTSASYDRAGQHKLAALANPTGADSVIAAIEGDKTLGGVAEDCIVLSFTTLGLSEVGQIGYYGGRFVLRVIATGS